jgi:23S rRNA pseudouridine1911/1915/1917 synthase
MEKKGKERATLTVAYEDDRVLLVVKPFGMPTQKDETGDPDAQSLAKELVGGYVGMFSRLDRPAGGLILFAKDKKAAAYLTRQFKEDRVGKRYAALVVGLPDENRRILTHWLVKDRKTNRVTARTRPSPGALQAITAYEVESSDGATTLVSVSPQTGRPHQIRVQLAAIGHPVVGDVKYGAPSPLPDQSVALFACGVTFAHPSGGKRKSFDIPLPAGWTL